LVTAIPQVSIAARFKEHGLPVFATESEAVAALNQFLSHMELMRESSQRQSAFVAPGRGAGTTTRMLNEADSLALLQRYGIPVVEHRLCRSPEEAVQALGALGAPVAAKGCSADVVHKSELGLVKLHLRTAEDVRKAYIDIERRLHEHGSRFDGVLIAKMVSGRRELMIGARIDPVFGPVVVVGDGGKYVEAMPDVQLLLPPFNAADVRHALSRLRIAPLLDGVRGELPMDVGAFAASVVAVGQLVSAASAGITNLDLNPVMVGDVGTGCRALDAVVYVAEVE
jgi:acyl-CoA synthetase (NDP forming)